MLVNNGQGEQPQEKKSLVNQVVELQKQNKEMEKRLIALSKSVKELKKELKDSNKRISRVEGRTTDISKHKDGGINVNGRIIIHSGGNELSLEAYNGFRPDNDKANWGVIWLKDTKSGNFKRVQIFNGAFK
tara:strand:- start:91222 stop:91614 length:393 start_codon:yes stop_codon:yes gene_type:complete